MLNNREGLRVPDVVFKTRQEGAWVEVSSRKFFSGRRVVVFALPGAYTPTCSTSHVPRFNELAPEFKANGIDEIVCISVNDPFVMDQWRRDQGAEEITFLPDGNGSFTEAMGMLVDKSELGLGQRSWRYSMLVEDGVIRKMFIEPEEPGDPYQVSDADTMLTYINPAAGTSFDIALITKAGCPYCAKAKAAFQRKKLAFDELVLHRDISSRSFRALTGSRTVPQAFVNGEHIGGLAQIEAWTEEHGAA